MIIINKQSNYKDKYKYLKNLLNFELNKKIKSVINYFLKIC